VDGDNDPDRGDASSDLVLAVSSSSSQDGRSHPLTKASFSDDDRTDDASALEDLSVDEATAINVVILDSAQKKFPLRIDPEWDVLQLKRFGEKTHKVPPQQQRLIYRGKLLSDTASVKSCGITENKTIIHLFPKPRVIVTSSAANGNDGDSHQSADGGNGAHIPQIVLDEDEAEQRGQILVLGSHEVAEAQNNVKLLSLLLLVFCSMRLLTLFSIAMGIAEDPNLSPDGADGNHTFFNNDDAYGPSDSNNSDPMDPSSASASTTEYRTWQTHDYFDLLVSGIGFYVATLGMKATNENTLHLAQSYFIGTFIAGIAWNAWNIYSYIDFVFQETNHSHSNHTIDDFDDNSKDEFTRDDFITVAFFMVLLPLCIWFLCCFRAYEFRNLLRDAEEEATERIRSQQQHQQGGVDEEQQQQHEMTQIHVSSVV